MPQMSHPSCLNGSTARRAHAFTRYVAFALGVWLLLWIVLAPVLKGRKIRGEDVPPPRQLVLEFLFHSLHSRLLDGRPHHLLDRPALDFARPRHPRSLGPVPG